MLCRVIVVMLRQQEEPKEVSEQHFKKVQNYVIGSNWKLGAGSFSEVFKAIDCRNDKPVAIKIIKMQSLNSKAALKLLQQEIEILRQLDHTNVMKCYDVLQSPNHCYIVTEFCEYGDLEGLLKMKKKFGEEQLSSYIYQIYQGLRYLSDKFILHRDLKPANIFVARNSICKIADFGFAIHNPDGQIFKDIALGSPAYMAPEAIHMRQFGPKNDVWAFGCLLYQLLSGHSPFWQVRSAEELREKVLLPIPAVGEIVTTDLMSLLERCLCVQVKNRISFQEMENHPYMQRIIAENQTLKLSKEMSETKISSKSSQFLLRKTLNNRPMSYDQAVAIMQYCRLAYKVCKAIKKSQILESWLMLMITDLRKTRLRDNEPIDYQRFKEVVENFYLQCKKQYGKAQSVVRIDSALRECRSALQANKKDKELIIELGNETMLLKESISHPLQFVYYSKNSRVLEYLSR